MRIDCKALVYAAVVALAISTVALGQAPSPGSAPATSDVRTPTPEPGRPSNSFVETGGSYSTLTQGFGNWSGGYARAVITTGRSVWDAEINHQSEFHDQGTYMALGNTLTFNPDWYGSLTIGSSVGGFFYPRIRTDAFINRKWLHRRQLITSLGFSYDHAKDAHFDNGLLVGATYYFDAPWIIEGGIHINDSRPGSVFSSTQFLAVTQGREKHHYLVVRAGAGREAYQLIGPTTALAEFPSQTFTITWRQWAGRNWGFNFVADYYHNSFYQRGGSSFGLFKEF